MRTPTLAPAMINSVDSVHCESLSYKDKNRVYQLNVWEQ